MEPLVSVLIPVYNADAFLRAAVESILQQTYTNLEILCINDGSSDDSPRLLAELQQHDSRVQIVTNERNLGLVQTLNKGLSLARGKYIARMDADDLSLSTRIAHQVAFMEQHPKVAVVGTWFKLMDSGEIIRHPTTSAEIKVKLLANTAFAHPTVMLRQAVFSQPQYYYDENYRHLEDFELWTRVAKDWEMANLAEVLLEYRVHPTQVTQDSSHLQQRISLANHVRLKQLENLGVHHISAREAQIHLSLMAGELDPRISGREYWQWQHKLFSANKSSKYLDARCLGKLIATQRKLLLKRQVKRIFSWLKK